MLGFVFLTAWCFRDAFFPPPEVLEKFSDMPVRSRVWNLNLLIMSVLSLATCIAVLPMIIMKKRSTWVWYVVMGFLIFGIVLSFWRGVPSFWNLIPTVVLTLFWYSTENRRWYRVIYTKD